jgi:hypothetical protein
MNQPWMPSPAILVAVLALVAALAGTAVAAPDASTSAITKKKVKKIATKQANEAIDERLPVGSEDIGDQAVGSPKLADGAVTAAKLANGAVSDSKVAPGAIGARGLGEIVVRTDQDTLNGPGNKILEAKCLAGEQLIAGGAYTQDSGDPGITLHSSYPTNGAGLVSGNGEAPRGWQAIYVNTLPVGYSPSVRAIALCLR